MCGAGDKGEKEDAIKKKKNTITVVIYLDHILYWINNAYGERKKKNKETVNIIGHTFYKVLIYFVRFVHERLHYDVIVFATFLSSDSKTHIVFRFSFRRIVTRNRSISYEKTFAVCIGFEYFELLPARREFETSDAYL